MYIVSVGCRLSAVYCAVSSGVRAQRKSKAHLPACLSTCPMSICLPAHLSTCIFALPCIAITIASQSQTTGGEERPSLRPSFHSVYKFFEKFPGTPPPREKSHARTPRFTATATDHKRKRNWPHSPTPNTERPFRGCSA